MLMICDTDLLRLKIGEEHEVVNFLWKIYRGRPESCLSRVPIKNGPLLEKSHVGNP